MTVDQQRKLSFLAVAESTFAAETRRSRGGRPNPVAESPLLLCRSRRVLAEFCHFLRELIIRNSIFDNTFRSNILHHISWRDLG